jgi:glutamate dehydrogenase/leucine dehydrogenase
VDADVVIPGARPAVISRRVAESLPSAVQVIAPAANVPYTRKGADTLHRRGIAALPDFVCNAGAVIGYRSAPDATPEQVLANVGDKIETLIHEALSHPRGPLAGACERAAAFLHSWWGDPPGPPFVASLSGA